MLKTRYKNDGRATLVLLISNQGHEGDLHEHLSRCGIADNSSNPSQVFRDLYTHTYSSDKFSMICLHKRPAVVNAASQCSSWEGQSLLAPCWQQNAIWSQERPPTQTLPWSECHTRDLKTTSRLESGTRTRDATQWRQVTAVGCNCLESQSPMFSLSTLPAWLVLPYQSI